MAGAPNPNRRKTRTRQHVIADLGVNYVQRIWLLAGHTADRNFSDYGCDLKVQTFDENGGVENGGISIQVKSTDQLSTHADALTVPLRIETRDFTYWLLETDLVVLMLYDAEAERVFWLDVQEYARQNDLDENAGGETITLRLPIANALDVNTVRVLQDRKNLRMRGV